MDIQIDLDYKINEFVNSKNNDKVDISDYIYKIVEILINEHKIKIDNIFVSIQSATKEEIKSINKEYRNIDKATDVLSFPIFSKEELENIVNEEDTTKQIKELNLGDIILCLDIIEVQALEYETGILRETLYMITHGMCHLLGYDHMNEEEKKQMREMEEIVLNKIGVNRTNE